MVVDSIRVTEADTVDETMSMAEVVRPDADTIVVELLSGLHFPAEAMPAAATSTRSERIVAMMKVKCRDESEVKIGRQIV